MGFWTGASLLAFLLFAVNLSIVPANAADGCGPSNITGRLCRRRLGHRRSRME
jgi:hypothetical protein